MENSYDYRPLQKILDNAFESGQRQLVLFKRQCLQRFDFKLITYPDSAILKHVDVQRWIYDTIFAKWLQAGVITAYNRLVWKETLLRVEHSVGNMEDPEILDILVDGYAEMCAQPGTGSASNSIADAQKDVQVFYPLLQNCNHFDIVAEADESRSYYMSVVEKPQVLSVSGGSCYKTWQSAMFLASYLLREWPLGLLQDKTVLELGCGTGLISLLCSAIESKNFGCPHQVIATDGDSEAIRRLSTIVEAERDTIKGRLKAEVYSWGDSFGNSEIQYQIDNSTIDLVLAADVLYDPQPLDSLVETIKALFEHNKSMIVVIVYARRILQTASQFLELCSKLLQTSHSILDLTSKAAAGFHVSRYSFSEEFPLKSQSAYFCDSDDFVEGLILTVKI